MHPVTLRLSASYDFLPKVPTTRTSIVIDQFGIGFDQRPHEIAQDLEVACRPATIVLFTGESGSGKSSLLRAAARSLSERGASVLTFDAPTYDERSLIDQMPCELEQAFATLALCGLGEAQLLLRSPRELSDGQRYRFRLALALALRPDWVVADEFAALLDRRLARVIANNLKRVIAKTGVGFLLATTHDDLVEEMSPDQHVQCRIGGDIVVRPSPRDGKLETTRQSNKKKRQASAPNAGSAQRPNSTGRTSLGGITAATGSG